MKIVTFSKRITISQKFGELHDTMTLNPGERYVIDEDTFAQFEDNVNFMKFVHNASDLTPYIDTSIPDSWRGKKVLFYRNRGIGDQLIASCLSKYFTEVFGAQCFQLSDRTVESIWKGNHFVGGCSLQSPMHFDSINPNRKSFFDKFYPLEIVSEWDNEEDQPNVYDRMFQMCGIDSDVVPSSYKRPFFNLTEQDIATRTEWLNGFASYSPGFDYRKGFIVYQLNATNIGRTVPIQVSNEILQNLETIGVPIVLVGDKKMSPQDQQSLMVGLENTHNAIGTINTIRLYASLIHLCNGFVGPDSSGIHFAAAFETPSVGLWGPFDPDCRAKYYPNQNHIFHKSACNNSPCFNYLETLPFPKCPNKENQTACELLLRIKGSEVLEALKDVIK